MAEWAFVGFQLDYIKVCPRQATGAQSRLLSNYDALRKLSRGGEAIHFFGETLSGAKGFARFVDGKAIHPMWLRVECGQRAAFDYERNQWEIGEIISEDFDFDVGGADDLILKYTSIDTSCWFNAPFRYCYIK